jgi:hypothetical protein
MDPQPDDGPLTPKRPPSARDFFSVPKSGKFDNPSQLKLLLVALLSVSLFVIGHGVYSHSEAANAAGLADLLKLIDASQLAAVASGASSAAEALELGTDRTARSKPRSKAPWRRGL